MSELLAEINRIQAIHQECNGKLWRLSEEMENIKALIETETKGNKNQGKEYHICQSGALFGHSATVELVPESKTVTRRSFMVQKSIGTELELALSKRKDDLRNIVAQIQEAKKEYGNYQKMIAKQQAILDELFQSDLSSMNAQKNTEFDNRAQEKKGHAATIHDLELQLTQVEQKQRQLHTRQRDMGENLNMLQLDIKQNAEKAIGLEQEVKEYSEKIAGIQEYMNVTVSSSKLEMLKHNVVEAQREQTKLTKFIQLMQQEIQA